MSLIPWRGGRPLARAGEGEHPLAQMRRQMDELFRHIKGSQESLDKGEAQMTYYQVKKLMKDLQQGYTMDEFWRLVEQITRQKPRLPQPEKKTPSNTA